MHISSGSSQNKWHLVQVEMYQSDPLSVWCHGVYQFQCYIENHKDCTQNPTIECFFGEEIREMRQDGTLGKILPVRPLRLKGFLHKCQENV